MSNDPTPITWTFNSNDVAGHRDLTLRLALRTLLFESFIDVDLDTVLEILRSEEESLRYKMTKAPEIVDRKGN